MLDNLEKEFEEQHNVQEEIEPETLLDRKYQLMNYLNLAQSEEDIGQELLDMNIDAPSDAAEIGRQEQDIIQEVEEESFMEEIVGEDIRNMDQEEEISLVSEPHIIKHQCEHCGKSFLSRKSLTDHIRYMHGTVTECSICAKTFTSAVKCFMHLKEVHKGFDQGNLCNICGKKFQCRSNLIRHMNKCGDDSDVKVGRPKSHHCVMCEKAYSTNFGLLRHIKEKHQVMLKKGRDFLLHTVPAEDKSKKDKKVYSCAQCGALFTKNSNLKYHVEHAHKSDSIISNENLESNQIKFRCYYCVETFISVRKLIAHKMKIHPKKQNFPCVQCGK